MELFLQILLLVVGFVLLIKGADIFVNGASSTAQNFRVSKILIGLTIVAFGTSAPELAVSISALASGSTDMVLGNVIGSCIINILLILGLAAVIHPIKINDETVKKELPLTMLISTLLVVLFLDVALANGSVNQITREDGIVVLLFFMVFLYYLITLARRKTTAKKATKNSTKSVKAVTRSEKIAKDPDQPKYGIGKSVILVVIGLMGIVFGSQLVVDSASGIAVTFGMSERLVALTIVALGTSLPELVTSVVAACHGEPDLAVGNVIGSNIFNICIVLGIPVVLFGTVTPSSFQMIDLVMLIGASVLLFIAAATRHKITRTEGALMLAVFVAYYGFILLA